MLTIVISRAVIFNSILAFCLFFQFREAVQDCKLIDSDDTYLVRWLIGINRKLNLLILIKILFLNFSTRFRFDEVGKDASKCE